jgi:hypothetical protein
VTVKSKDWVEGFLARFDQMDEALVSASFPATSPWWRSEIEDFLRSGRRRWVIRAGRRSGKSTTISRLMLCWALFGGWTVPIGDMAIVPVVSTDHRESSSKLRTVADILSAMGISYERRSDEIEIPSRRVVFRSITCSVRGVVGFTAIGIFGDEMSRWESRDDAANPAAEVMGSMRPSMATQPLAIEICSSSPWSLDDYHAELYDAGTTEHQFVSFAETWTANPTISEARTHELEPDERTWAREYAAIPGITLSAAFDPGDLAACFKLRPAIQGCPGFLAIDASALRGDAFAYVAGHALPDGALAVIEAGGFTNDAMRTLTVPDVVKKICERAEVYGVKTVFADNYEKGSLPGHFESHGIELRVFDWSQKSKHEAMTRMRRMMREKTLALPDHGVLRKQLGNLKQRLVPSGGTKYFTNGLDYASALLTAMHAEVSGDLVHVEPAATYRPRIHVHGGGGIDNVSCDIAGGYESVRGDGYAPIRGGGRMSEVDRYFEGLGMTRAA